MTDHDDASTSEAMPGGLDRRTLLKRSAVAGAVVFAAPMITSRPAAAAASLDQTEPVCLDSRSFRFKWEAGRGFEGTHGDEPCFEGNPQWVGAVALIPGSAPSNPLGPYTASASGVTVSVLVIEGTFAEPSKVKVDVTGTLCDLTQVQVKAGDPCYPSNVSGPADVSLTIDKPGQQNISNLAGLVNCCVSLA
jgi:hypothetical protein